MSEVEQKKKFVYHGSMSRVSRNSVCVCVCVCVCEMGQVGGWMSRQHDGAVLQQLFLSDSELILRMSS